MPRTQSSRPKLPLQDRMVLHALRLKEEAQAASNIGPSVVPRQRFPDRLSVPVRRGGICLGCFFWEM